MEIEGKVRENDNFKRMRDLPDEVLEKSEECFHKVCDIFNGLPGTMAINVLSAALWSAIHTATPTKEKGIGAIQEVCKCGELTLAEWYEEEENGN
jgi:hypothetical protein